MICIAMILAFIGNFNTLSKEECIDAISEYLLEEEQTDKGNISVEDLERAKAYFNKTLPVIAFSKEEKDIITASEEILASISIEDLQGEENVPSFYYSLPISPHEEKIIYKIISTMASKNIFSLLLEKRSLERKGKHIEHLHPFRFLGCIFSHPQLKNAMKEVRKSTFKWDGFMDGLIPRMKEEAHRDNLLPYISGFAEHVHADPERISYFIRHRNWDGLVKYLM